MTKTEINYILFISNKEDYIWMCRSIKYGYDSNWLLYEDLEKKRKEDKKKKGKQNYEYYQILDYKKKSEKI